MGEDRTTPPQVRAVVVLMVANVLLGALLAYIEARELQRETVVAPTPACPAKTH